MTDRPTEVILAALSAREQGNTFLSFQVQNIVFFLEYKAGKELGIQNKFNFLAGELGPADVRIYKLLEIACNDGLAELLESDGVISFARYTLTAKGHSFGQRILNNLDENVCRFVNELVIWATGCSFHQLLQAVRSINPEMVKESINNQDVEMEKNLKMDNNVKQVANFVKRRFKQDREIPSKLDLTSVPKSQEQEYKNAIIKVCKDLGVPCPEINFLYEDPVDFIDEKIDGIFAGIADKTKLGNDVQIRLNYEDFPHVANSMLARLQARLQQELGYTLIKGSRERIINDDDEQIAIVLSFEKAKENVQVAPAFW